VNELPGNEAALSDATVNQTSETHTPGSGGAGDQERAVPQSPQVKASRVALALLAAIAAWLVPGLGHLLLGRRGRALVFFVAVAGLVLTGYWLRGNVFLPHSGDLFGTLGFLSDAGTGALYYFSRYFEAGGPDVSRAAGDYGTRFIAAAGVVNVLAVLDAIEIATGRRS
jgi:TM2 domain-containing membrane protein YozV